MWYLLCLEILHSDPFWGRWYCYACILIGWVPFFSSRWQDFLLSLHSNWQSGLEYTRGIHWWGGLHQGWVIPEGNVYQTYLKVYHLKININLGYIFVVNPNPEVTPRNLPVDMTSPVVGGGPTWVWSTYIHTHDRLDKPHSALTCYSSRSLMLVLFRYPLSHDVNKP